MEAATPRVICRGPTLSNSTAYPAVTGKDEKHSGDGAWKLKRRCILVGKSKGPGLPRFARFQAPMKPSGSICLATKSPAGWRTKPSDPEHKVETNGTDLIE